MKKPKIIVWDIETLSDMEAIRKNWFKVYSPYKNNGFSAELSSVICIGWKELHGKKVNCIKAWDHKTRWKKNKNDDLMVLKEFSKVIQDADGMMTHNGRNFDFKFVNTRLLLHGLPPLPKIKHIDTKVLASRNLSLLNNRLGHVAGAFSTDLKIDNGGAQLWEDVHQNKKKALKTMEQYCKGDVVATQGIFERLRPFSNDIPNYNLFMGVTSGVACGSCGGNRLYKHGKRSTRTKLFQRYRCEDCGTYTKSEIKSDKKPTYRVV